MMKKHAYIIATFVMFVMVVSCYPVLAQQGGGRGGAFRGEAAKILCDALILDNAKTEKVVAAYTEASAKVRESMQGASQPDFQSMTQEERQAWMEKRAKDTAAILKVSLKDTLAESELAELEGLMARRSFFAIPELRALRLIDLQAKQRDTLLPSAIKLSKAVVPFRFPGGDQADAETEKLQKAFDDEKAAFLAIVSEVLTAEQKPNWEAKSKEVQKEIDDLRAQFQNR